MRTLAEQALDNLVDQFARPLDFLRELVQNALDAGSPRVEVRAATQDDLWTLTVTDWGHGMDRATIEGQLTKLFASEKAGDLTQIGRFGIGFASVFAVRPDRVVVTTGRQGTAHQIVFDADRSFVVNALSENVVGTVVRIEKSLHADAAERLTREARYVLTYWCEHCERPIVFIDGADTQNPASDALCNPFAAFAQPIAAPETVSRPMALDEPIQVRIDRDGFVVLAAISDRPRYSFYSHGLTLVSTDDRAVLGDGADSLGHLALKVAGPGLDHTLTRDNVMKDAAWRRAMAVVKLAHDGLWPRLIEATVHAVAQGSPADALYRHLTTALTTDDRDLPASEPLFATVTGPPVSWSAVESQEDALGVLLVGEPSPLCTAIEAHGRHVLADSPAVRALLTARPRRRLLGLLPRRRVVVPATERYWVPDPTAPEHLCGWEAEVFLALGSVAADLGLRVRLAELGGPVAALGQPAGLVDPGSETVALRHLQRSLGDALLVNRYHPDVRTHLHAWFPDTDAAARAILHTALLAVSPSRALSVLSGGL